MADKSIPLTSGIYQITCTETGKIYIGSTSNLRQRHYVHFWSLRSGKHDNKYLQNAFNKYGEDVFVFEVIELVMPWSLMDREQYWLDTLKPYDRSVGFNIGIKANSGAAGRIPSDETRMKLSQANSGKVRSEQARQNMSNGRKGLIRSKEHQDKLNEARKRYIVSDETRSKQSATRRGKKQSPKAVEQRAEQRRKVFVVTNPNGEEFVIKGLAKFCREYGLRIGDMSRVASGQRKHCKGWKCRHV